MVDHPLVALLLSVLVGLAFAQPAAQPPPAETLFRDVRLFDGSSTALSGTTNVLVHGDRIAAIGLDAVGGSGATVIAGGGRTLRPGLIDAHAHVIMAELSPLALLTADPNFTQIAAARTAGWMLMRPGKPMGRAPRDR